MGVTTMSGVEVDITNEVHRLRRKIKDDIKAELAIVKAATDASPAVTFAIASNAIAFVMAELVHAAADTVEGRSRILRSCAQVVASRLAELDERVAGTPDDGSVH